MKWIKNEDENNLFISVLTIGKFHKGIEKLPDSKRKQVLHNWVENDLKERFSNRSINIDLKVVLIWGKIPGMAERKGHHLTIATRNISDMKESGAALINPWE